MTGGVTTHYIWQGSQVIAEHNGSTGAVLIDYVYSGSRMIAKEAGATTEYFLSDRLSTRLVLDTSGNVLGRQAHLPFGENFAESGSQEKHHFTSYERDGESGLDYAVNRGYSPVTGRFRQPDPYRARGYKVDPQSWNRYRYSRNDPINLIDRLGLDEDEPNTLVCSNCTVNINGGGGGGFDIGGGINVEQPPGEPSPGGGGEPGGAPDWIDDLIAKLGKVNKCEAKLARKIFNAARNTAPLYARELIHARTLAEDYENQHGGVQDDNPVNARKHCIWSCEMSKHLNEESARKWGDAHECNSTSPSSNMDLHNNWIGRLLGNKARTEGKDCKQLCEDAGVTIGEGKAQEGWLWALRP